MEVTKSIVTWGMVFFYVTLNAAGALLIKNKINDFGPIHLDSFSGTVQQFIRLFLCPQVLIGFTAIFGSALAWMVALSRLDLSTAYPAAVGLNFVIVIVAAILFFNEALTISKAIGITLVLLSLYFLAKA